jgi:hypothetical protein
VATLGPPEWAREIRWSKGSASFDELQPWILWRPERVPDAAAMIAGRERDLTTGQLSPVPADRGEYGDLWL